MVSEEGIEYLRNKDKKLREVIDRVGHLDFEFDGNLFAALVRNIIGQQISAKAHAAIWNRLVESLGTVNADSVLNLGVEKIQSFGISFRKAGYIFDLAKKVGNDEVDLDSVNDKTDEEAISELVKLKGVGVWTAEMLLLFCLGRPNILSYNDLGIQRGLCLIYHHKEMTRSLFEKYKKRFSPYGSLASLYIWSVAGGAVRDITNE